MTDRILNITRGAYALAYQMVGERADALDIVQDAATTALTHSKVPSVNCPEYKSWFYRVVRNRAIDLLRRRQKFTHEIFDDNDDSYLSADKPEMALDLLDLKQHICEALEKIKISEREIILLKDYHDFSYAEIAEILDIPSGTVMSRLHRARLSLRKLLIAYQSLEVSSDE